MALFRNKDCPDCGEPRVHVCEPEYDGPIELADGLWRDDSAGPEGQVYLVATTRLLHRAERRGHGALMRELLDETVQDALDAEGVPPLPPVTLEEVA